MTTGIRSDAVDSALQVNGVDAVPFDADGLKAEAFADDTIAAAKLASDVPFKEGFTSGEQVITDAGALIIPHGLSNPPSLIQCRLVCQTADAGYAVGDEVIINTNAGDASLNYGVSVVPDATNINIRYGNLSTTFLLTNKTTGNANSATNANWKFVVRAWV